MGANSIKYNSLFSFSLEQLFYENKYCKKYFNEPKLDMQFIPTQDCIETMNRLDMLFRKTDHTAGFTILARTLGENLSGDPVLRYSAGNHEKLGFWIMINNPEIINFNNIPVNISSSDLFYFSNGISDPAALRSDLHTTIDPSGVVDDNDITRVSSPLYRFHHTAPVADNTAKVKHLLTGIEIDPKTIINTAGESDLAFELYDLPSGKCRLLINNVQKDEFYYAGTAIPGGPLFGVIEIFLSKLLDANYRVVEPDFSLTSVRPYYKIKFINRQTFWRYTIRMQINSPLYLEMSALSPPDKTDFINMLNIVTNDSGLTFTQISASDTEFTFQSVNPVALKDKYFSSSVSPPKTLSLTLKKYVGIPAKEAAVRSDLPFPQNNLIDAINFPLVYSDVFLII